MTELSTKDAMKRIKVNWRTIFKDLGVLISMDVYLFLRVSLASLVVLLD
jgi:hypothetical protein